MNLLIINSAKEWGGTEKWALYTAHGLAAMGHTVFFGCRGEMFKERALSQNVVFVQFPLVNNADISTILKIRTFINKNKIDIVIPSKQREYFLAGIAAKLTKAKVAGLYGIDRAIHNLRNWIVFCKLFNIVFVNAKKIIEVLSHTKAFDTNKCKLVYVGVEPISLSDTIRKRSRQSLGIADHEICLMGIGRVAPQKGFDYAIKALALLVKKLPNVKLVLIGSGEIDRHRQLAVESGVVDKVVFTGFRDDIHELVQAMDIFWLPSRSEGIPNTMLEAMSAGKPVVAFEIAGVAEIIKNGENGYVVPFENIDLFYSTTATLIENPSLMKQIGDKGYTTVRTEYSMEKMCKDTERFLMEIVKLNK
jgi:glycosyltransferase involved in cell wall biosynthesis